MKITVFLSLILFSFSGHTQGLNCFELIRKLTTEDGKEASLIRRLRRPLIATGVTVVAIPTSAYVLGPSIFDFSTSEIDSSYLEKYTSLASKVSSTINDYFTIKSTSLSKMRSLWSTRLDDNRKVLEALDSDWGIVKYFYSKEDLALYGLMINPDFKTQSENYFGAYLFSASEKYLLKYVDENYEYTFRDKNYEELLAEFRESLPKVSTPTIPRIEYGTGSSFSYQRYGTTEENEKIVLEKLNKLSKISTPLFLELLKKADKSVSQAQLFEMAMDIYEDPFTALGVIGYMTAMDGYGDRSRAGLVELKTEDIIPNTYDPVGLLYHFWNYAIRVVYYGKHFYLNRLSWGYETLYQKDKDDRLADKLGIELGRDILKKINQ